MRRIAVLCIGLMAGFGVVPAGSQTPGNSPLEAGITLVKNGAFEAGLLALDPVVRDLEGKPGEKPPLVQAHVYLGVAYVGLEQEAAARNHFKQAAALDPSLRLDPGEFSPRVLRVFEAARKGKNKAVLYGGGLGLAAIGGIAAAAALVGGTATAVAVTGEFPTPTPTPPPPATPTPPPTPTTPGTISPPGFSVSPGSAISGCSSGSSCNLAATVAFLLTAPRDNVAVVAELVTASGQVCLSSRSGTLGRLTSTSVTLPNFTSRCAPPFTTTGIYVGVLSGSSTALEQSFGVGFSFR